MIRPWVRDHDQTMRSKRLFHLLQQNLTGYSKIENLIKSQISALNITESNGFELLRLIRKEFSLLSRSEALGYRDQCIKFRSQIICQTSWEKCRQRLNLFIQCWKLLWSQPSCKMSALVKVISICCIWDICLEKCKSFFNCIRMPRQCSNFSLEFRIIISEPEFKVTWVQFMWHSL